MRNVNFLFPIALTFPLWLQSTSVVLRSTDGIVYALVAKELSRLPMADWGVPTWFGNAFYEHPPLFLWFMALFFKVFGVSTYAAIVPALILASLTILVFYLVVKELVGEKLSFIFLAVAFFDYSFIKYSRNPMLEVPLTFFLTLSLLFIIRYSKRPSKKNACLSGLAVAGALATKGIVGLLPVGMYFLFCLFDRKNSLRESLKCYLVWLGCVSVISIGVLGAIDLWHFSLSGVSFWKTYLLGQVFHSVQGRGGGQVFPIILYLKPYFAKFVPNAYLALAALGLFFVKRRYFAESKNALLWGASYLLCLFFGLSLAKHARDWYINIHFPGTWLMIGSMLCAFVGKKSFDEQHFKKIIVGLSLCLCVFCAFFPILTSRERTIPTFFEKAAQYSHLTKGKRVGDCINLDSWKGRFSMAFYLDAKIAPCHEQTEFLLTTSRQLLNRRGPYQLLFSHKDLHLLQLLSSW